MNRQEHVRIGESLISEYGANLVIVEQANALAAIAHALLAMATPDESSEQMEARIAKAADHCAVMRTDDQGNHIECVCGWKQYYTTDSPSVIDVMAAGERLKRVHVATMALTDDSLKVGGTDD